MKRVEALVLALIAFGMIATSTVLLFGPYGLLGSGVALGLSMLLFVDVKEE